MNMTIAYGVMAIEIMDPCSMDILDYDWTLIYIMDLYDLLWTLFETFMVLTLCLDLCMDLCLDMILRLDLEWVSKLFILNSWFSLLDLNYYFHLVLSSLACSLFASFTMNNHFIMSHGMYLVLVKYMHHEFWIYASLCLMSRICALWA